MSLHDYEVSKQLSRSDVPFSAYIMAAMRKADTMNTIKLRTAFPDIWDELQRRYESPGGVLPEEEPKANVKDSGTGVW